MKGQPPQEWRAPGKKQIEKACANERQVVLSLAGGEIIFFELDEAMQNIQARSYQTIETRSIVLHRHRRCHGYVNDFMYSRPDEHLDAVHAFTRQLLVGFTVFMRTLTGGGHQTARGC